MQTNHRMAIEYVLVSRPMAAPVRTAKAADASVKVIEELCSIPFFFDERKHVFCWTTI